MASKPLPVWILFLSFDFHLAIIVCLMLSFQLEGEKRKDHSSAYSKEHFYQCERDFDVHSCNKIIISFSVVHTTVIQYTEKPAKR